MRTFALNYLKEPALKAESDHIIKKCVEILGTDNEQVQTFALNYLKEPALKDKNGFITEKCIEILGTDDEQVRTFAQNYLKEVALKDKNGFVTKKCIEILGTKGNIVKGIVKNITNYGVFVDIGGIVGLLHITNMAWTRISHPSEVCAIGDTIEVVIMDFDLKKNRVSLGLKQKTADPREGD